MKCIAFISIIAILWISLKAQAQNNIGVKTTSFPGAAKCFAIGGANWDNGNSVIQTSDGGYAIVGETKSFGAGGLDVYVVKLDNTGTISWTRTIGGTNDDFGHSIIQTSDGGYAIAGYTSSFGAGDFDVYVVKLNSIGDTLWTRTIGGTNCDYGMSIIQTSDGGYIIVGSTESYSEGYGDVYVVKLDRYGTLNWTRTIGGTNDDMGFSIIQTSDGGYAIVGYSGYYFEGFGDIYVIKLNNSGDTIWTRSIDEEDLDVGYSIIQTSDGGYAITGYAQSIKEGSDVYVLKFDSYGTLSWTRTIGGTNDDFGYSIIQTSDGGYAIAGSTQSFGAGDYDFYMVKLNSSGDILMTYTFGGASRDLGHSIIQTSDEEYIIVGETQSYGAGKGYVYVVKLANGTVANWTCTIGGADNDFGYSIIQTSDGGYAIAGYTNSFGAGDQDVYIVKLNSSGDIMWTRTIGGASDDLGKSIIQTSDGGYAIAGHTESFGAGEFDLYVVKLDSNGDTMWTRTIGGASDDLGKSIIQTSDGGYIIAGSTNSFGAGSSDVYVVKLNSSGDALWTRTIGGTYEDNGNSIIQTSDGGYAIAGWTNSFSNGYFDVYVIKLNSNGDTIWTRTIGEEHWDNGLSIIQTNDGEYVITGWTGYVVDGYERDVYVIKLASNGDTIWTRVIGGSVETDEGRSIIQTTDENYLITGLTESFDVGNVDVYMLKLNTSGDTLWTRTIGGANYDEGWSIIQTSDGGYAIAGSTQSFGAGYDDVYVIKLDSNGNTSCCITGSGGLVNSVNTSDCCGVSGHVNKVGINSPNVGSGGILGSGGTITNQCP